MKLIKLDAIDSTSTFLMKLYREAELENYSVIIAKNQTKGKGQMGNEWNVEPFKNLTFSFLVKNCSDFITQIFDINVLISVAVYDVLTCLKIPKLSVKWPNDIMSDNKKIGGILIENAIKSNSKIDSVIGIGINVNQTNFSNLPNAASLYTICNKEFEVEQIAIDIVKRVENLIFENKINQIWEKYQSIIYKKEIPSVFEDLNSTKFMGIIKEVTKDGKLAVLLENDSLQSFSLKQIKMML